MLASQMPWYGVALCTAATSYIFFGLDELGLQVEQPFNILPLWQLCHLTQFNIEEALASPELPLRVVRQRKTDAPEAERFDIDDDDETATPRIDPSKPPEPDQPPLFW